MLQSLEVSESTLECWRRQYDGIKTERAIRLKKLEQENKRMKELVVNQQVDIKSLTTVAE